MTQQYFGGYQQVLAQMEAEEGKPEDSKLAKELLALWSWGAISGPLLQSLANAVYQDGLTHPQVERLAKLGGSGRYPGNMQRGLLVFADELTILKSAESIIPIRVKKQQKKQSLTEPVDLKFILPHKLFSCLYHSMPSAFENSILGGSAANVTRFWAAMKNHPVVTSRPQLSSRKDLAKVVPIGLHGDGVTYMQTRGPGGKSLDVLSWTSLLTQGVTKVSSFLMSSL